MHHSIFPGKFFWAFIVALGCLPASAEQGNIGAASFYSAVPSSSGGLTAAHPHLPFGTRVRVTRIDTGKHVVVLITDRGPFVKGRIIDLSFRAAKHLGMIGTGVTQVKLEVVGQ